MNVKINKRLVVIGVVSIAIAIICTFFIYQQLNEKVQPEVTESIAYFKNDLEADTIIDESNIDNHIEFKKTPTSLIPQGAIKTKEGIKNKRTMFDTSKEDYVLTSDLTERGDIKANVDNMYVIGIDIDNISNFLGTQLKKGDLYELVYVSRDALTISRYKAKLVNIIDSTGKVMTESSATAPKTVNVAVESYEDMLSIAQNKRDGNFDLVKPKK